MQVDYFQHGRHVIFRDRFAHATATRVTITGKWSHGFREQRTLLISFTGHDGRNCAAKRAAFYAVVAITVAHHERSEIRVTQSERAKDMRVLRDLFDRITGVIDYNFLRGDEDAHRRLEAFDIKLAVCR